MVQKIEIPVVAETASAERNLKRLGDTATRTAQAMASVPSAAGGGAQSPYGSHGNQKRNVLALQATLSRKLGTEVSRHDAFLAERNFRATHRASPNTRGFNSMNDYMQGSHLLYATPSRAEAAQRRVMAHAMAGTSYAAEAADMGPGAAPPPGGGMGGGGGRFPSMGRAGGMAMGFGRTMLGLAGIGGAVAMAGKAASLASDESFGADSLKRRLGDVGIEFDRLRHTVRQSGVGLGISFNELQRQASTYAREVGNLNGRDMGGLSGNLRTSVGFARAYGMDPTASTEFFGSMARSGVGRDESGQRRFAMLIGDAVAKSGFGGKVEEILRAVADYSTASAKMTLSTPNASAFTNALTSLMSRGLPGLDPAGSAGILGAADAAIRRGGAMGEASFNFSFAALRNGNPNINAGQAMALMEGGLFGTTESVFGGKSPLAKYRNGLKLNSTTNFERMMPLMRQHYGDGWAMLSATKQHFGLNSMAQAAALSELQVSGQVGETSRIMGMAGVDPSKVNATGFQMFGQIANASGRGQINDVINGIAGRKDLKPDQRAALMAAVSGAAGGTDDQLKSAVISALARMDVAKERTTADDTRDSLVAIENALTSAGAPLLMVLNTIRAGVGALASMVPGYIDPTGTRPDTPWASGEADASGGPAGHPGGGKNSGGRRVGADKVTGNKKMSDIAIAGVKYFMAKGWSQDEAAALMGRFVVESNLDTRKRGDNGKAVGLAQWHKARWKTVQQYAAANGFDPFSYDAQFGSVHWELTQDSTYKGVGKALKAARNNTERMEAVLRYERPKGTEYIGLDNYKVAGFADQVANTAAIDRLTQHLSLDVVVKDVKGNELGRTATKLPTASGAPRPAGTQGGRAPLTKGTRDF